MDSRFNNRTFDQGKSPILFISILGCSKGGLDVKELDDFLSVHGFTSWVVLNVWYIYLHLAIYLVNVGNY